MPAARNPPPLVAAAQALEDDLAALEGVARDLERATLSSHKAIQRAAHLLEQSATLQEGLAQKLASLVLAIDETRTRQEALLGRVLTESQRVKTRHDAWRELMERFGALGERAREVSAPVSETLGMKKAGASPDDLVVALDAVAQLADALVSEAEDVGKLATDGDFPDVARDTEALRQSMLSARNKISLARRQLKGQAAS